MTITNTIFKPLPGSSSSLTPGLLTTYYASVSDSDKSSLLTQLSTSNKTSSVFDNTVFKSNSPLETSSSYSLPLLSHCSIPLEDKSHGEGKLSPLRITIHTESRRIQPVLTTVDRGIGEVFFAKKEYPLKDAISKGAAFKRSNKNLAFVSVLPRMYSPITHFIVKIREDDLFQIEVRWWHFDMNLFFKSHMLPQDISSFIIELKDVHIFTCLCLELKETKQKEFKKNYSYTSQTPTQTKKLWRIIKDNHKIPEEDLENIEHLVNMEYVKPQNKTIVHGKRDAKRLTKGDSCCIIL